MSDGLPEGWVETPFSELISELRNGISTRPNLEPPGTPILRISATRPGAVALDERRYLPKGDVLLNSYGLREKDLLFTRYNGSIELLGVCGMVRGLNNEPLLYPDKLMRVRLREHVAPEFIEAFFQSRPARQAIMALAKSSAGQQGISGSDLKEQIVRLAPLPEQHRIVEKVEALLEQVNRAKARLDRVPLILKRFRQAVLAAACSGELTREWRGRNGQVTPKAEDDLPPKWRMVSPDDVAASTSNALTIGPFGSNLKVSDYRNEGVPLVFVREIRAERFGDVNTKYVSKAKAAELSSHTVRPGDLLITKMGEPPGDTSIYPRERPPGIITADCIKLTPNSEVTTAEYLRLCLRAEPARTQILERSMGVAQQKLSLARFREIRLPMPPLREQDEIVKQVGRLFALADTIERRVQAATARANKLPQAILSKAFTGELVPTEAELARLEGRTYETAEELLKRVTALGSDAPSARKGRGRRTG